MIFKENGVLLSNNPSEHEVGEALKYLLEQSEDSISKMRLSARAVWCEKFNAKTNAEKFSQVLMDSFGEEYKQVIFVTNGYPFGGESSFLESEVIELLKHYKLTLVAIKSRNDKYDEKAYKANIDRICAGLNNCVPSLKTVRIDMDWSLWNTLRYIPAYFFDNRIGVEKETISQRNKRVWKYWESIKYYSMASLFWKKFISSVGIIAEPTIVYTYWQLYSTLAICMNKSCYNNVKLITRTHGYDLFDERVKRSYRQPFREVMEPNLDKIFFACNYAKDYYISKHKVRKNDKKYNVSYLGSTHIDSQNARYVNKDEHVFRIVSCSNVIKLKRVELIVNGIKEIADWKLSKEIEWIHFGDGDEMEIIKDLAKRLLGSASKVSYQFMGEVSNEYIHKYYEANQVDCFITTSSTECFPVSIQEAMSYGIPIIATDVGGIREAFIG